MEPCPSVVHPGLYDVFGGIEPRRYPWQVFTAVFEHGWPGLPALVHLGLNVLLIVGIGPPCERLLGSGHFLGVSVASATANTGLQLLGQGVNGSSLVIWCWGPPVFLALRYAQPRPHDPVVSRLRGILVIMYVLVTLVMAVLPYLGGFRGNPLTALLLGNQYHVVATGVGALGTLIMRDRIQQRATSSVWP